MRMNILAVVLFSSLPTAEAAQSTSVQIEWGPIKGRANATKVVSPAKDVQRQASVYDVQDGLDHNVRGLSLKELLATLKAPKSADAVVFNFTDGMQIPVQLSDEAELSAVFIAFEHGDVLNKFGTTYPVRHKTALPCPKIVFSRKVTTYSIWHYPGELASIRVVTWKTYEAMLAQPTRRVPDRSGWPLYLKHCQSCHGIGKVGAQRGPDFLSNMDAYRRVPPLAATDQAQHPSLHEKVKGFTEGTMPVLNHLSNAEVSTLWRWLHVIHASATK